MLKKNLHAFKPFTLLEGKSFDVHNAKAMEAANKFNSAKPKEVELEVVDTNADSEEHLLNKKDYVGQRIIQCTRCRANRFVDVADLKKQEDGSYKVIDNLNDGITNTCPHCNMDDVSYISIGDVAAVSEEPKLDNSKEETASFDNDVEEEKPEEEKSEEEKSEEVEPSEEEAEAAEEEVVSSDEEEFPWDETDAEDDTVDMKDNTGKVINRDDVPYDDTEEEPTESEILKDEKEEKAKKEALVEEENMVLDDSELKEELSGYGDTVKDLLESFISLDDTLICVFTEDGKQIYEGSLPRVLTPMWKANLVSWDVGDDTLVINASKDGIYCLEDCLELLDENTDTIELWDSDSGDILLNRVTKSEVIEKCGQWSLDSLEEVNHLNIVINGEAEDYTDTTEVEEDEDLSLDEALTKKICKANKLSYDRVNKVGSQEYWIAESINSKEDLKVIYDYFVNGKCDEALVNEFKQVTGFRTDKDRILEESAIAEGSIKSNLEDVLAEVKEFSKSNGNADVVYGYTSNGNFYRLPEFYIVGSNRELQFATELVKAKYHPSGTVHVWYGRNNIQEAIVAPESDGFGVDSGDEDLDLSDLPDDQKVSLEDFKKILDDEKFFEVGYTSENEGDLKAASLLGEVCTGTRYLVEKVGDLYCCTKWLDGKRGEECEDDCVDNLTFDELVKFLVKSDEEHHFEELRVKLPEESNESIRSFKDRKSLSEAIKILKNNKQPYKIKRSLKEGYRYDLIINESQAQEISDTYRLLSSRYGVDMEDLVYGEDGFMKSCYPSGFDDFKGDVIYSPKHWEEFEKWLKDVKGIELKECVKESKLDDMEDLKPIKLPELKENKFLKESPEHEIATRPIGSDVDDVVGPRQPEETTTTAVMDPRDQEVVDKLVRIANDTAAAIHKYYGINADPRLIVADMIQDLRLVGGTIRPEELEDTPMNNLTKEMYRQFDGFNDLIDMLTGQHRDRATRLSHAIASLDGEEFTRPAIEARIDSPAFIAAVNGGALPYIANHIERLPEIAQQEEIED